jgi:DNA (cytosine-5)-methyltransferase 1
MNQSESGSRESLPDSVSYLSRHAGRCGCLDKCAYGGPRVQIIGLFSGIGGLELGFQNAGHHAILLNEIDEACQTVLRERFATDIVGDIFDLKRLPQADAIVAGFPCQPFSQAGPTSGLHASRELLRQMFSLIAKTAKRRRPSFVILENVQNIVHLERGRALAYVTRSVESLGYKWAYRIIDTSAFGLPQRRRRWVFVASLDDSAASILLDDDVGPPPQQKDVQAHGFYWTEGNAGLGWAHDSVPPLKAGSGVNIPSPPAIWVHSSRAIVKPQIADAEALQGFPPGWTAIETDVPNFERKRWKMIGNAVSVPIATWIAERLSRRSQNEHIPHGSSFLKSGPWPLAALGRGGQRYCVPVSAFPIRLEMTPIMRFLQHEPLPLSARATRGFRCRLQGSNLRYPKQFLADLLHHEQLVTP